MILFVLLLISGPRDDTAEAPIIQDKLKSCGHSEGAVRFTWQQKPALAYACSKAGQTTLLVYAPLPSGQYGLICDSAPLPGVAHTLEGKVLAGSTMLYMQSIVFSPDEERVVEAVFAPRWGKCTLVGKSDVRHPDDGPSLREPLAGIELDEQGFDAFESISRLQFRAEAAVGPKRRVAMAMKGKRYEPKKDGTFDASDIVLEAVQPVPHAQSGDRISFAKSPVRGVRVRFAGENLKVRAGEQHLVFSSKTQRWITGPQLFGAGMLAKGDGAIGNEGLAFFDPPLELDELTLEGKAEQIIVFKDGEDWPLFEAHEDFGESVPHKARANSKSNQP